MAEQQPVIKLPQKISENTESSFTLGVSKKEADKKFSEINTLLYVVMIAIVIMVISTLISVGAMVIDQLHFNNLTYREFSVSKKENDELARRITAVENKTDNANQQIIIEQQKQNMGLLKKTKKIYRNELPFWKQSPAPTKIIKPKILNS